MAKKAQQDKEAQAQSAIKAAVPDSDDVELNFEIQKPERERIPALDDSGKFVRREL